MNAPNDVAALVERARFCAKTIRTEFLVNVKPDLLDELADALATQAAAIAALQAEVERAKEDERDRLYALANSEAEVLHYFASKEVRRWLSMVGAMLPSARSASRKENTP